MYPRICIIEQRRLVSVLNSPSRVNCSLSVIGFTPCAFDCPRSRDFFCEEFAASPASWFLVIFFLNTTIGVGHGTTTAAKLIVTSGRSLLSRPIGLTAELGAIRNIVIPDKEMFEILAKELRTSTALSLAVT